MNFESPINGAEPKKPQDRNLALERTFLDSLHSSRSPLLHGAVGQSASSFLFWVNVGDIFYIYIAAAVWLVWVGRFSYMKCYDRHRPFLMSSDSTPRDLKRWNAYYMIGTGLVGIITGSLAGYSIAVHPESWASGVALALALGMMISVIGRNHGSTKNVWMVLALVFIPIIGALIYYGLTTNLLLGFGIALLLLPFALSTKSMTFAVRQRFLEADRAFKDVDQLKQMFYDAISNMPDGLLVVSRTGELRFATNNARKLFDVKENLNVEGLNIFSLLETGVSQGSYSRVNATQCKQSIRELLKGNAFSEIVRLRDNLFIEFSIGRNEANLLRSPSDDESLVMICADVTDRIKSADKVTYLANFDVLSKLPNRRHMRELILEAHDKMHAESSIAFCVFDVDKFKDINDTLGHASGDEVIKSVGRCMLEVQKRHTSVIVSRLGGDEFVMALPSITKEFQITTFFDEAFDMICKEHSILGKNVDVRCSGGVIISSRENFQFDDAYTRADLALYQVKQLKRTMRDTPLRWKLFDEEMEMSFKKDQQLRFELTEAIAQGKFPVEYQPMFSPNGLQIETFEALARWERPGIGIVGPDEFIPIAESMNIIGDITRYVVEKACRDCATWVGRPTVSVNLSVLDLASYEIIDIISTALRKAKLPADRLQVEITESVFLKDTEKAHRILTSLHAMGVKTAIDDFGTGYSNLSHINKLPLDKVKIDKSFIKDIDTNEKSRQLFEAVVSMGKKLNLSVIVEGVETMQQLSRINEVGVDLIQGFIFARPMDSSAANDLLIKTLRRSNVIPLVGKAAISHWKHERTGKEG